MATATQPLLGSGLDPYSISVGVSPTQPYTPQDTSAAISQIYANAFQAANPNYLLKKDYNPGTGTDVSASNYALMAPQIASILSGANQQAANQSVSDASANANSLLQGQQLQANTALGLAGIGQQQQNTQFNQAMNQAQFGQNLLGGMFGGQGLLGSLFNDVEF